MAPSPLIKQRMADVRDRKREVQAEIKKVQPLVNKYKEEFANANVNGKITQNKEFQDAQRAVQSMAPLEAELGRLKEEEMYLLQQMSGMGAGVGGGSFMSDPSKMNELASLAESKAPIGPNHLLGLAQSRDELVFDMQQKKARLDADPSSTLDYQGAGRTAPVRPGVVSPLYRDLRLLNAIPTAAMEERVMPYVQQVIDYDTALETPELELKPEAATAFEDIEMRAATIAHYQKASRQALSDYAGLATAIQQQLMFGVNDRLEKQIVNGDEEGENILGILNTTGIGDVEYNAEELASDAALDGITDVMLSNANPSGILLNPRDWAAMLKEKSSGSGEYMSMGPFASTAQALWGCPLIPSKAIAQGKALVGDCNRGCTVFVREGVNVRMSDADQDDFVRNRITLLGEGRFGFAIWYPQCFCVVNFTA